MKVLADNDGVLFTTPDFGCIEWAARPPWPTPDLIEQENHWLQDNQWERVTEMLAQIHERKPTGAKADWPRTLATITLLCRLDERKQAAAFLRANAHSYRDTTRDSILVFAARIEQGDF